MASTPDPNDPLAELARLREEQRAALSNDIRDMKQSLQIMQRDIHTIQQQHATNVSVNTLSDRVYQLENDKAKIVGGFVALAALQSVVGFIIWILSRGGTP